MAGDQALTTATTWAAADADAIGVARGAVPRGRHQAWPGDQDYAGIDIFRLDEDGKVLEHWDVLQALPTASAHDNGMF